MRRYSTSPLLVILLLLTAAFAPTSVAAITPMPFQEEEQDSVANEEDEKSYADVISDEAITSKGLIDTHMVGDDLFYEIPLDVLDREMLLLTRIARTPDGAGYGGSKTNTSTVRWQRNRDQILLRLVSYQNFADDTTAISAAVRSSTWGSIPKAWLPASASPESLSRMRRYRGARSLMVSGQFASAAQLALSWAATSEAKSSSSLSIPSPT